VKIPLIEQVIRLYNRSTDTQSTVARLNNSGLGFVELALFNVPAQHVLADQLAHAVGSQELVGALGIEILLTGERRKALLEDRDQRIEPGRVVGDRPFAALRFAMVREG
jgi:hypothetical protein